jgi:hypothetical protein
MTYIDNAHLSQDAEFVYRLGSALGIEALARSDELADTILIQPSTTSAFLFMPAVSSSPGFGDLFSSGGQGAITDGDILSAVQANWVRIATATAAAAPPP